MAESVLYAIRQRIDTLVEMERLIEIVDSAPECRRNIFNYDAQIVRLKEEIEQNKAFEMKLYETLQAGLISQEEYFLFKKSYADKIKAAEVAIVATEKERDQAIDRNRDDMAWMEEFKKYEGITFVERKTVVDLIEKIVVYDDKKLDIVFRFADEFDKAIELLELLPDEMKAGKVNCVLVKDLSRFGRDYIEAGEYLEKIFPFMGVRFIAITDGYDSLTAVDSEGSLMVPLKNMINEAYAKDISRKIITSFRARQEKGEYLPAFAPYGYVKSKTNKYRYEIDPETAPYVRMIFEWKAAGISHNEICRRLNDMDKEGKAESESITHQRALIQEFVNSNPELCGCRQYEFFDDGYSGTNFERPGFERLIGKIRKQEINCVIVKDFSRFGRNYIELGDYLERIFPFLGVRFISINDHYDSVNYKGTTGGLDVVMKNIIYDYYSKDLSRKVMTAKRAKMKRGLYIGGHVPYGLKRDPSDKHKLIIDQDAAAVVREIFDCALEGKNTGEIARILNAEGIETPGQYYRRMHPDSNKFANLSEEITWNAVKVLNILKQEMYYGAVVGHKREAVYPCSKETKQVPLQERIVVEGMHEAIVSKEEWTKAQEVIRRIKPMSDTVPHEHMLKFVIRCGCCGRSLKYFDKKKSRYYKCGYSRYTPDGSCYSEKFYAEPIEKAVTEALRVMFDSVETLQKKAAKERSAAEGELLKSVKRIAALQTKLEKVETDKFQNVDRFMANRIKQDEYLARRDPEDSGDLINLELPRLKELRLIWGYRDRRVFHAFL